MKVIELLLQDKKVWDKNKTGYYSLDGNVIIWKDVASKGAYIRIWKDVFYKDECIRKLTSVDMNFLLEEGEEYIEG